MSQGILDVHERMVKTNLFAAVARVKILPTFSAVHSLYIPPSLPSSSHPAMKQKSRELLVTTKVAQAWQGAFDQRVDELMVLVSQVDTEDAVQRSTELLDVYHHDTTPAARRKAGKRAKSGLSGEQRPFEFLVGRN